MNIQENLAPEALNITDISDNFIEINGKKWQHSILLNQQTISDLPPSIQNINDITFDILQAALQDGAEVLLIGTGKQQQFLHPKINAQLAQFGVNVECMNTASACRTINMLQVENRKIWACLFLD